MTTSTPVSRVLIHKRPDHDSYAVAITDGSPDYHDARLMASMELDMPDEMVSLWSAVGWHMARRILELEAMLKDSPDE